MDHYSTLGVAKNATPDEIKKAYRKLASQHHPDKGGDTNTFQQIQTAYDTLSDPTKRQQYDNPMPRGPHGFNFNFGQGQNIHDIFSQFGGFENIFRQHEQQRGVQNFRTRVNVTLLEAYNGTKKTLQLHTNQGANVITIDVPKGINQGQQIKYENLIPNANLLIEFLIEPDLRFDRQLSDLYSNVPVSVFDLVTGTKLTFMTISGKQVEVSIKPLTQPYMQLKLVGQGMPILHSPHYGDQILLLKPYIPDTIDKEIVDILQKHKK